MRVLAVPLLLFLAVALWSCAEAQTEKKEEGPKAKASAVESTPAAPATAEPAPEKASMVFESMDLGMLESAGRAIAAKANPPPLAGATHALRMSMYNITATENVAGLASVEGLEPHRLWFTRYRPQDSNSITPAIWKEGTADASLAVPCQTTRFNL